MIVTNQRVVWIDIFKGIAIILIVIAHHPLRTAKMFDIVAFAIPLFFFISGYLFNPNVTFRSLLQSRFNSILKPYLFTVILTSLIYIIVKGKPFFLWYVFWTVYGNGPNLPKSALHLWFLPNLFLVTLLTWLIFSYTKILKSSFVLQLLVIMIFLIIGFLGIHLFWNLKIPISVTNFFTADGNKFLINGLLDNPAYSKAVFLSENNFILNGLPWSMDIVLISTSFFISGYFVKHHHLEYLFKKSSIALILFLIIVMLHYLYNYSIDLNVRRYDDLFIVTFIAFASIYFCTYASYIIAGINNIFSKTMQYVGERSLIIFIFHPLMQSKVYYSLSALIPNSEHIAVMPAFVAGLVLPLLLNHLLIERFSYFRYWFYAR